MRYLGGKARISKPLSEFLNTLLEDDQPFVDAFCGSCNVVSKIGPNRVRVANDLHYEIIEMWKALQNGWIPPENVSEEEYKRVRLEGQPHEKAFVGFGCSFSGKYWGGYARCKRGDNYARSARNSSLRKISEMKDVLFSCGEYYRLKIPETSLVYCDIPYKDSTGYSTGQFDHTNFYEWAKSTPNVVVSEYAKNVPDGATTVWSHNSMKETRNKVGKREPTTEVVFTFDQDIIQKCKGEIK